MSNEDPLFVEYTVVKTKYDCGNPDHQHLKFDVAKICMLNKPKYISPYYRPELNERCEIGRTILDDDLTIKQAKTKFNISKDMADKCVRMFVRYACKDFGLDSPNSCYWRTTEARTWYSLNKDNLKVTK